MFMFGSIVFVLAATAADASAKAAAHSSIGSTADTGARVTVGFSINSTIECVISVFRVSFVLFMVFISGITG
jgi:hypothetical protein